MGSSTNLRRALRRLLGAMTSVFLVIIASVVVMVISITNTITTFSRVLAV